MKQINNYIQEKLKLNKSVIDKNKLTLFPKTKEELLKMIKEEIKENGNECSLNHIDVSNITDMSSLFWGTFFKDFNGDISDWDVSNVNNMSCMFYKSKFNGDISKWNVSNVANMAYMFENSDFKQNISNWNINKDCITDNMFKNCKIKYTYKPKLLQK